MNPFLPTQFFQLQHFAHAALFQMDQPVWKSISTIADYLKQQKLGKIEISLPEGVTLVHPELISIGQGSKIEAGAYIMGPCLLGKNCVVRHGAYIRGNVITGDNCLIGHATEVKNSLLLNHAKAAHFAYLGDTLLGNDVNVGAGAKFANFKFDGGPIVVREMGDLYPTGMKKMGAVIGDRTQIGCNAVTLPGTLIGPDSMLMPCINFGGVAPPYSRIALEARALVYPITQQ